MMLAHCCANLFEEISMRFPIDPPPPIGVTDDPYEIQEKAALTPTRPVGPRTQPPLALRQQRQATRPAPPRPSEYRPRAAEDRRTLDRRVSNQPVLVDTRSGLDRRKGKRRGDDPTTRINEKA